uniref:Uncharacterized protein n=1 Tax=Zea mays TaxID=4577 RepID=C0HG81_MAIZE|nr:unknown [Zea mays]
MACEVAECFSKDLTVRARPLWNCLKNVQSLATMMSKVFNISEACSLSQCSIKDLTLVSPKVSALMDMFLLSYLWVAIRNNNLVSICTGCNNKSSQSITRSKFKHFLGPEHIRVVNTVVGKNLFRWPTTY